MNDRSSLQENRTDDLDMVPVMLKAIVFFRRFGKKIIVAGLVGMIVGGFLYYLMPRDYKATMVLQSPVLSNAQGLRVINGWGALLSKSSRAVAAQLFKMREDQVSELHDITAEIIPGSEEVGGMTVEVAISDTTILPALQQGMAYALENNPYIKQRIEVRRQNLQDVLSQAQQELRKLDSIKPYLQGFAGGEKDANGKLILDVSNVSNQRMNCEDRITNALERLHFLRAVYVLQGFIRSKASKIVPAPVLPLLGFLIGFLISYGSSAYTLFREKYLVVAKPGVVA
jgi:hypothetical protein